MLSATISSSKEPFNCLIAKETASDKYSSSNCSSTRFIYLLYSGCKKTEENWSNGTQLLVYTWDGKPYKRYWLGESIYSFAIDELQGKIYSFSLNTETLIVANL